MANKGNKLASPVVFLLFSSNKSWFAVKPKSFFNDLGISFGLNSFRLKEGRDATNTSSQLSLLLTCWSTGCALNGVFTRVSKYGTASLFWPEASPPARIHTNSVLHLTCDVTIKQPINATEAEKSRVALTTPNCNTLSGTRSVLTTTVWQLSFTRPAEDAESILGQEEDRKAQETAFECDHCWPGKRWVK